VNEKLKAILDKRSREHDESSKRKAERNREDFPECGRILDLTRETFGPDCKAVWCSENGREIGKRSSGVVPVIGPRDIKGSRRKQQGIPSKAYLENMGKPEGLWADEQK